MKYKDTMSLQMLNSLCLLSMFVVGRSEDAKKFLDELGISSREEAAGSQDFIPGAVE